MSGKHEPLWPFGARASVLTAVAVWLGMSFLFVATRTYLDWPDDESIKLAVFIVLGMGLIPLALLLLDFAARSGVALSFKGLQIDFSRVDLTRPELTRQSLGIPDNIGVSGPIISDTTPMSIIKTLREVTSSEIVVIDLRRGEAWWVTRLLALSAGAVRAGAPTVLVFIGTRENRPRQYLGWADPKGVLESILRDKAEYRARYDKAVRIARQVVMYGQNELLPQRPDPFELHTEVGRYTGSADYAALGEAVTEQILMDQLAKMPDSLEAPPDRLTLGRLADLFGHCLSTAAVDLEWPKAKQVSALLEATSRYVALVKGGRYESMIEKGDGERLLLRELLAPRAR